METRRVSEGYSKRRFIPPNASGYLLSGTRIFDLVEALGHSLDRAAEITIHPAAWRCLVRS